MSALLNEEITRDSRGTVHAVIADGRRIGAIVHQPARPKSILGNLPERWYVHDAGAGVDVDKKTGHATSDEATAAIVAARDASPAFRMVGDTGLTQREVDILTLERDFTFTRKGSKDQAVADLLGMTMNRYLQLLARLLEKPEALAYDPMTVARLTRIRDSRPNARIA